MGLGLHVGGNKLTGTESGADHSRESVIYIIWPDRALPGATGMHLLLLLLHPFLTEIPERGPALN